MSEARRGKYGRGWVEEEERNWVRLLSGKERRRRRRVENYLRRGRGKGAKAGDMG